MSASTSGRLNLATIVSIAIPAFALESVVHEVVGHTLVAYATGVKVVLITSTVLQFHDGTRLAAGAGPVANLFFGALAFLLLRRFPRFSSARLFLWLFAFSNLLLGTGYILYSGVLDRGDSAIVVAGLQPAWLYHLALIAFGALGYRLSVRLAARDTLALIRNGSLLPDDVERIVYPSCIAGAVLYVVASIFNPVSPSVILSDGLPAAVGVSFGLLLIPRIVRELAERLPSPSTGQPPTLVSPASLPLSVAWLVFGSVAAVLFVILLGHGIRPG
jgi:hypothetical protein